MSLRKTDKIRLTNFANGLRAKFGIQQTQPVSIHQLLRANGIIASFQPLSKGFEGMAVKLTDNTNGVKRFMLINTNSIYCRQRFTACHELYHLLYQDNFMVSYDVDDVNNQTKDNEEHFADYFARCLLLPIDGIWQQIPESEYKIDTISLATILKIEQNYRCSRSCLLLRLKEMGVISETVFESFSHNVIRGAVEYGYPINLYSPNGCKELIGDYNVKARQLYDQGLISQAKYFSLLKDMGIELRKENCDGKGESYIS